MPKKTIKLVGLLLVILAVSGVWFFLEFKTELLAYVILLFALLLLLLLLFLSYEIEKLQKINTGIMEVLENSEKKGVAHSKAQSSVFSAIDNLSDGILFLNEENKVIFINNSAENILGVNRRKVLKERIINVTFPVLKQEISKAIILNLKSRHVQKVKTSGGVVLEIKTDFINVDGKNKIKQIILTDITKLEQAQDIKEKFIFIMGHQMKTPLSAIRMSAKMMQDQNFGKVNLQQKDVLGKIQKASESLISLSEDMLESVKNNDYANSIKKPVDLEKLTDSVLQLYQDSIKEKKIKVVFKKSLQDISRIFADSEKIKVVIQNLIENAIKYNLPKGKIEIEISKKDNFAEFKISDSGLGIPEDQKEKIFLKFSRVNNNKVSGHGLGLAISKDIIESYKGKIWFDSNDKKGSTFYFSLPFSN